MTASSRSLKPARLQVIVMARSLAVMLPSLWQESVKGVGRDGVSWPDFLALQRETHAPVTDALLIVRRWLAHIPAEQVHVVTVPPAGTGPAVLLGRFSDVLGIDTTSWAADDAARNVSIDMVQTETDPAAEPGRRGILGPSCTGSAGARRSPAEPAAAKPGTAYPPAVFGAEMDRVAKPVTGSTAYASAVRFCTATWTTS